MDISRWDRSSRAIISVACARLLLKVGIKLSRKRSGHGSAPSLPYSVLLHTMITRRAIHIRWNGVRSSHAHELRCTDFFVDFRAMYFIKQKNHNLPGTRYERSLTSTNTMPTSSDTVTVMSSIVALLLHLPVGWYRTHWPRQLPRAWRR